MRRDDHPYPALGDAWEFEGRLWFVADDGRLDEGRATLRAVEAPFEEVVVAIPDLRASGRLVRRKTLAGELVALRYAAEQLALALRKEMVWVRRLLVRRFRRRGR